MVGSRGVWEDGVCFCFLDIESICNYIVFCLYQYFFIILGNLEDEVVNNLSVLRIFKKFFYLNIGLFISFYYSK